MKAVKAAVCITLILLIFVLAPAGGIARADVLKAGGYAYADIGEPVYFCSEKRSETALFAIPQTYCVQILSIDGDWLYVRYAEDDGLYRATYGYCLSDGLIPADEPPENAYLNCPVTIKFKAEAGPSVLPGIDDIEVRAAYYGEYVVGNVSYLYVLCNDKFGYVYADVPSYPLNPLPSAPTFSPTDEPPDKSTVIVALLITGVAAVAIIVLYISGKKRNIHQLTQ